jgi:hypothetical protein
MAALVGRSEWYNCTVSKTKEEREGGRTGEPADQRAGKEGMPIQLIGHV